MNYHIILYYNEKQDKIKDIKEIRIFVKEHEEKVRGLFDAGDFDGAMKANSEELAARAVELDELVSKFKLHV